MKDSKVVANPRNPNVPRGFIIVDYHEDGSPIFALPEDVEKGVVQSILKSRQILAREGLPLGHAM